jgi:hypothetical protein
VSLLLATPQGAQPVNERSRCAHGNVGACGHCMAEAAPKCKHGSPFYCGFCLAETGGGSVGRTV